MKQTLQLGALSATNICITMLFLWYVVTRIGPGMETDALFAGMAVPQLVLAVINESLINVLVPILAGEKESQLINDAWGLLLLVAGFFGALFILLYIGAPWWVPLTVPGFDDAGVSLTVDLTRIQCMGMVLVGINGVQWAAYRARQRFLWAELAPVLAGVVALVLLIWSLPRFGVMAAAWVAVVRIGIETLLLSPGMLKRPFHPNIKSEVSRYAWQRIKPLLLGTAYYKTDPLVDRFLLSMVGRGSLSLYYLAYQIYVAGCQVLNKAITVPLVPSLSMLCKQRNRGDFRRTYRQSLLKMGAISFGSLFIFALFGRILLYLLVGHWNINAGDVTQLWWIMIWLGGLFAGGAMGQISSSSFYAAGNTVTPTRIYMTAYTVYIPAKVVAFYFWGVAGLAVATSTYYMVIFAVQIFVLEKEWVF